MMTSKLRMDDGIYVLTDEGFNVFKGLSLSCCLGSFVTCEGC